MVHTAAARQIRRFDAPEHEERLKEICGEEEIQSLAQLGQARGNVWIHVARTTAEKKPSRQLNIIRTTLLQGDRKLKEEDIRLDQRQRVINVKGVHWAQLVLNEAVWSSEGKAGTTEGTRRAAEDLTRSCT